jgi:flavodoxin
MKILVVFYSWTGHTGILARELAQTLDATVARIEPLVDLGKDTGRLGMKALFGGTEAIAPVRSDLSGVDHLVIATPVWGFNLPPYTRQYLAGLTNCAGKKFSVLAEMGGMGGKRVVKKARKILEAKGMQFVASAVTIEKDVDAGKCGDSLAEFAGKIREG